MWRSVRTALALRLPRALLLSMEIENNHQKRRHFQATHGEEQFLGLSRRKWSRLYLPSLGESAVG